MRRAAHDVPEILRADLAPAALLLRAMEIDGFDALEWLDAPPSAAAAQAESLLRQLGAEGRYRDARWRAIRCIRDWPG